MESSSLASEIPPELLALVFDHVELCDPQQLVNIAGVCRKWRDIIYSSPKYWTALHLVSCVNVASPEASDDLVDFVERWFNRTRDLPLSMKLAVSPSYPVPGEFQALVDYLVRCPRWERLSFNLRRDSLKHTQYKWPWTQTLFEAANAEFERKGGQSPCWPRLKQLKFASDELDSLSELCTVRMPLNLKNIAPNLEELKVHFKGIKSISALSSFHTNMFNLRGLEVNGKVKWGGINPMLTFLFEILVESPKLEHFTMLDYHQTAVDPIFETVSMLPPFPIIHTRLRCLSLQDSPATRFLLWNLQLPALEELELAKHDPEDLRHFDFTNVDVLAPDAALKRLLLQSKCNLRSLSLGNTSVDKRGLTTILTTLAPNLLTLSLDMVFNSGVEAIEFFKGLRYGPDGEDLSVLPQLSALSLTMGAYITPLVTTRLIQAFQKFVEDPRRKVAEGGSSKRAGKNRSIGAELEERFAPLENAVVKLRQINGTESLVYKRRSTPCTKRVLR